MQHHHDHGKIGSLHKLERLENPRRVQELNPTETLKRLGLRRGQTVCDIGAGTGIFALAAAALTDGMVYALETDDDMIAAIREKAEKADQNNVKAVKVDDSGTRFDLPDAAVDLVLIVTVLHEIDDKALFLDEVKRIMKSDGRLALIEFHARPTPFGPPLEIRIASESAEALLLSAGLDLVERFDLGNNYYCLVFSIQSS